jgi:pimeloyl-ACP methyl ester carboxylesterase
LILLHGIGMSHAAWTPVVPHLAPTRRVIAFDIAGFGATPPLAVGTRPTITNLVDAFERCLCELRIDRPVDIAGNSLGAAMALECARRGIARTAVAISPIGLWKAHEPRHVRYVFGALRTTATRVPHLLKRVVRVSILRELALAIPLSPGSRRMPARDATRAVDDLANATTFEETFYNTRAPFRGREIEVPVTIVFGGRDSILTRGARRRDAVPAHARWIEQPGWGHVPMWADPIGVTSVILDGTASRFRND